jgi:hypothetical protein
MTNDMVLDVYTVARVIVAGDKTLVEARWYGGDLVNIFVGNECKDCFLKSGMRNFKDFQESFVRYIKTEKQWRAYAA